MNLLNIIYSVHVEHNPLVKVLLERCDEFRLAVNETWICGNNHALVFSVSLVRDCHLDGSFSVILSLLNHNLVLSIIPNDIESSELSLNDSAVDMHTHTPLSVLGSLQVIGALEETLSVLSDVTTSLLILTPLSAVALSWLIICDISKHRTLEP